MDYSTIIITTYELLDEFKTSEVYKRYLELKEITLKFSKEFKEFNDLNERFHNLEGGKYNPSFKDYAAKLSIAKSKLFSIPEVKELFKLEAHIQFQLDEISRKVAGVISEDIKVPNELGILNVCNH